MRIVYVSECVSIFMYSRKISLWQQHFLNINLLEKNYLCAACAYAIYTVHIYRCVYICINDGSKMIVMQNKPNQVSGKRVRGCA